jgi:hypothetical protein
MTGPRYASLWHDRTLGLSGLLFGRFSAVVIWRFFVRRPTAPFATLTSAGGTWALRLGPVCVAWRGTRAHTRQR